mgnify:CR=1 FL=1
MRFHLVDKIIDYTPWKSAIGIKNITVVDELLEYSSEIEAKVFPKTLLCECVLQTCAWLIVKSSNSTKRPVILKFGNIEYGRNACIGDKVQLIVEILSYSEDTVTISGCAKVEDEKILCFDECLISLLSTDDLECREDTQTIIDCLFRED